MVKFFRLPIALLALTVAAPVFAADPGASMNSPSSASTTPAKPSAALTQTVAPKSPMVDINNATVADLKALPGVTGAEAGKIMQGRPFKDPSDLTAKKILTDAEYAKIKDRLVAGPAKS